MGMAEKHREQYTNIVYIYSYSLLAPDQIFDMLLNLCQRPLLNLI